MVFFKNMDGWTIWIHLKQCVTLDPSFNYGKVTFIKRIQKVNNLLLRMEDDMFPSGKLVWCCFLFVDSWHVISFGDVLGLNMVAGCYRFDDCVVVFDDWGCLDLEPAAHRLRLRPLVPHVPHSPTGRIRTWINRKGMNMTPDHGFTVSHQQFHAKCTIKAYQSTTWGSGRGQMQLSIFQERSSFSTRFRSTKRWQAFRQVRLRRPPKRGSHRNFDPEKRSHISVGYVEIRGDILSCNDLQSTRWFLFGQGHLWATGHHHHRTPPGDPVWSTGGLPEIHQSIQYGNEFKWMVVLP